MTTKISEPRYRVVVFSLITGAVRKVLIRDLSLSAAEVYREARGTTGSWRTGIQVQREQSRNERDHHTTGGKAMKRDGRHESPEIYDEEREDYASLADEMNDPDVLPWNEADWDKRAVANAKRYAAKNHLPWPPSTGDFDRFYEKEAN